MDPLKNTFFRVNGDKLAQHFIEPAAADSTKCLRSASPKNSQKGVFQRVPMKVLVFGKNGQLGKALQAMASTFSFDASAYDQEGCDIRNLKQLEKIFHQEKPDAVINAAAYHVLPECEKNPGLAMAVNFEAVMNIAKQCKVINIPFFTVSTDYVFDGKKGSPYEEADPPHPLNVYGISKNAGELGARNTYPEGTFIIRTCGLYGGKTGSPTKKGNFVLNILKEGKEKPRVEVTDDETVSPTFADDLARASLQLLFARFENRAASGIYHLVNEGSCTWYAFAKEIFRIAGVKTPLVPREKKMRDPSALARPAFSALKNKKAASLGIVLPSWQDGVKRYLQQLSS